MRREEFGLLLSHCNRRTPQLPKRGSLGWWNVQQTPKQRFVSIVPIYTEVARTAKWRGDRLRIVRLKDDRDVLRIERPGIVEVLVGQHALPAHAVADAGPFVAVESSKVDLRAHDQDEIGVSDLARHRLRPPFRRRHLVLADVAVDPVRAESIREREHPLLVLGRVVAVADEDPQRGHRRALLSRMPFEGDRETYP